MMSMGTGNTIVLLFSAEMLFKVCRYRSCKYHDMTMKSDRTFCKVFELAYPTITMKNLHSSDHLSDKDLHEESS